MKNSEVNSKVKIGSNIEPLIFVLGIMLQLATFFDFDIVKGINL